MERKITKQVKVGGVLIGGGAPISVQSMLNKPADDIDGSVAQALELQKAGCQIIRSAVPDMNAVKLIAAAYVGRLRELYDYHEQIETDYFSSNLKRWIGGVYAEHSLIE